MKRRFERYDKRKAMKLICLFLGLLLVASCGSPLLLEDSQKVGPALDASEPSPTPSPNNVTPSNPAGNVEHRLSYDILKDNKVPGPDGMPNHFFHTEDTARKANMTKYTSGQCRNYYQGEEWACQDRKEE